MTPEEHNKYVGIAHLVYGVIHLLLMFVMGAFFMAMMGVMAQNGGRGDAPPPEFFGLIMAFAVALNVLLAVPSFVAGYAFLKRKPWAKVAGIIAAVLAALRLPFGTAVSIYTFWFLFSAPGKTLYDNLSQALPPAPPVDWNEVNRAKREDEYSALPAPPDWR